MRENTFKNRLSEIVKSQTSVNAFAKLCGISESMMRGYLSGKTLPGLDKLLAIADTTHVSVEWLATGEGDKFRQTEEQTRPLDDYDRQILFLLEGMDARRKEKVLEMIEKENLFMALLEKQGNIMGLVQEENGIMGLVKERSIIMDMVEDKKKRDGKALCL